MHREALHCTCGHARRQHYGGSGRLSEAGTCKLRDCACRRYRALAATAGDEPLAVVRGGGAGR